MTKPTLECRTPNCIVTGELATVWGGHVLLQAAGAIRDDLRLSLPTVGVLAGFRDIETLENTASDERGCCGQWKAADGLSAEVHSCPGNVPVRVLLKLDHK